jgi:hypothetical protein
VTFAEQWPAILSQEERAKDAAIEAANRNRLHTRPTRGSGNLTNLPAMEFLSKAAEATWQSYVAHNTDPRGADTMRYAERWARLMQREMSAGKRLEDIYATTLNEADLEGMSGATGGMAEQILIRTWKYGSDLARMRKR